MKREQRPASSFEVPSDYERVEKGLDVFLGSYERTTEDARMAGRAKLGLDKPFEPTPEHPLPPALPGGSCEPDRSGRGCIESWDGREQLFTGNCSGAFDFKHPCPRNKLVGICETDDRGKLRYHYRGEGPPGTCEGRWYPAAAQ